MEFRAGIQTKQVNKFITLFLIPNRFSLKKSTYLLIIRSKDSSQSYSTMCSSFPHKSEQILFSVFRLCLDFCGKLLYIVERHLDVWLLGIMRRYMCMCNLLHHNQVGMYVNIIYFLKCFVRIPTRNSVNPISKTT